ncbi:MAG: class I SAM-dependent methyltransferase [Candidatus Brocadiae bacterium]|nr:class I SAM-dependent methyltransferase [Candidatus Brocadiia bacterium]
MCNSNIIKDLKIPIGIYSILKCEHCNLEFIDPQPDFEEIKSIYTSDYYKAWGMEKEEKNSLKKMKKNTFEQRIKLLSNYKKTGNILDIGTASGFFLEVAKNFGFEPYGVELSEYSAKLAQQKFGQDKIYHGILENCPFPKLFFDVIAMSDLLEHVQNPISLLECASQFLKEDGIIIITTPNTESFSRKIMGKKWTQYKPEHLFYFDKKSIYYLANLIGLKILKIQPAWKSINLKYFDDQFSIYKNTFITPIVHMITTIFFPIKNFNFNVLLGEFVILMGKNK